MNCCQYNRGEGCNFKFFFLLLFHHRTVAYELFCVEVEILESLTPIAEMYFSFKFRSLALHALKTRGETKINLLIFFLKHII